MVLRNFSSLISGVPFAANESERIKFVLLRRIVFAFALILLIAIFALTGGHIFIAGNLTEADYNVRQIWTIALFMYWAVWILLGTRYYKLALWIWAANFIFNTVTLVPAVPNDGTVYRVQIFLTLSLLIFSVYLRKLHLYAIAGCYYAALLFGIIRADLLRPGLFFPFTLAFLFCIAAIELKTRIRLAEAKVLEEERARALHNSRLSTLGETTAFLMHEVSSPLTIMQGHLELAQKGVSTPYHLERMQNALARAFEFITSVKRLARSTESNEFEIIQLSEILKIVSDLVEPRLARKNIKLEFEFVEDIELKCHPSEIAQVLINLINNSADAIIDKPNSDRTIKVVAERNEDYVDIEVNDRGIGIAPEVADKVMRPFFTTKPAGSGIGLSVAKQIAERHRGRIDILKFKNPTSIRMRIALTPSN